MNTGYATNITATSVVIVNNSYFGITGTINFVAIQYSKSSTMGSSSVVRGTIGSPYSVTLSGFEPNTTYYRAGVSANGSLFGAIESFTTPNRL